MTASEVLFSKICLKSEIWSLRSSTSATENGGALGCAGLLGLDLDPLAGGAPSAFGAQLMIKIALRKENDKITTIE